MPDSSSSVPQSLQEKNTKSAADIRGVAADVPQERGLFFWLTFLAICVSLFMSAVEVVSGVRVSLSHS